MNIIDCLQKRGFIDQISSDELKDAVERPINLYIGFDPTSDSLHLGNLMGIIALEWFRKYGHTPYILLGGATGRIGDPSGKSKERPLLQDSQIEKNIQQIKSFFKNIFDTPGPDPIIVNNNDWLMDYPFIDFLRDVGKQFRLSTMLAKESVKNRMEEEGMSFTEFSYQIVQAYDFYHLFTHDQVTLQMGGSDQWGNITAGLDLIRKLEGKSPFGATHPLLIRSDGKKFGKTEKGAVWLSDDKLSPYYFYQYLYRVPDADVIHLMKMLTFMDLEEIEEYAQKMQHKDYEPNSAQKRLAEEVTRFVHKESGLEKALHMTDVAKPGSEAQLDERSLQEMTDTLPTKIFLKDDLIGKRYTEIANQIGLVPSKSEAVKLIKNKGAYLNNNRIEDIQMILSSEDLIAGRFLLFAAGKKKRMIIQVKNES